MKKNVFVIDDHPLVRAALIDLITQDPQLQIVGEHDGSEGALSEVIRQQPDILLLDLTLKGGDGISLLRQIQQKNLNLKVLVISMHDEPAYVHAALKNGASGYLLKTNETELIPHAIRSILQGGTFISGPLQSVMNPSKESPDLTPREVEVVRGVVQGMAAKEIAEKLQISYRTVEVHRANAMRKLSAKNIAELTRIALELGINQTP